MTREDWMILFDLASKKREIDGCQGCAFIDREEWEMPCKKCSRNCRDYWRSKEIEEK